jgi:DNA-binding XRE family transcriptional regulator
MRTVMVTDPGLAHPYLCCLRQLAGSRWEVVGMTQQTGRSRVHWPEYVQIQGTHLRQARAERDLTQEALARKAGVSLGTILRLERSSRRKCRRSSAVLVARALDKELCSLVPTLDASSAYTAYWSRWRSPRALVADSAGYVVDLLAVPHIGDRPGIETLRQSSWAAHSDADWQEFSRDHWSVRVQRSWNDRNE